MISLRGKESGFTMIEAFVAIVVLIVAVLGPLALVGRGIADSLFAANQITAFYLAQEGMELVIHKRDMLSETPVPGDNERIFGAAAGDGWIRGEAETGSAPPNLVLSDCLDNYCDFSLETNTSSVINCLENGCSIFWNSPARRYRSALSGGSGDEPTIFRRRIKISPENIIGLSGNQQLDSARVEVQVFWNNRNDPKLAREHAIVARIFKPF